MKALRVVRHGAPAEALEIEDIPIPDPGPGEVRVAVSAASVNFGDIARCRGTIASVMGQVPFTLGMDVCGVVDATGEGAESWAGRRVVAMTNMSFGGIAEYALAADDERVRRPAAAGRHRGGRVHLALPCRLPGAAHPRATCRPVRRCSSSVGASAVGTAVIQLGVAAGADVIAIAGGPEKGRLCEELGATAIDSTTDDTFDRVMEITDGTGAEVVVDLIGGDGRRRSGPASPAKAAICPSGSTTTRNRDLPGGPSAGSSMGNFSVLGVMLGYTEMPVELRRFGINTFGPETGRAVHEALLKLVAAGIDPSRHRSPDPHGGGRGRARRSRAPPHHRTHHRGPHGDRVRDRFSGLPP